jgi:hypothetical protein
MSQEVPGLLQEVVNSMKEKRDLAESLQDTHPDKARSLLDSVEDEFAMLEGWLIWIRLLSENEQAATVRTLRALNAPLSNYPTGCFWPKVP